MQSATPVCVIGLGLIGGSILQAAAAAGREVYGYNRSASNVDAACAAGYDASTDLTTTLARANDGHLIVIAVPEPAVPAVLAEIAAHAPHAWLTDAVSVKSSVTGYFAAHGLSHRFAGGHPMAGTSTSGWEAAKPTLFVGARWVVIANDSTSPTAWFEAAALAIDCGAVVVATDAAAHDAAVARISHSVHLLAEAAAITAHSDPEIATLASSLAAGSFRDVTRVAGTAPALVRAMVEANREATLAALDDAIAELTAARTELATTGTVAGLVERGHAARSTYEAFDLGEVNPAQLRLGQPGWQQRVNATGGRGSVLTTLPTRP